MTPPEPIDARDLVARAEAVLAAGRPEEAATILDGAGDGATMEEDLLPRFAEALARAHRFLSRHADTAAWIDKRLAAGVGPAARAALLAVRLGALRQIDPRRVLTLCDEALEAARTARDDVALARCLAHASFCAYRAGDARRAARFAEEAERHPFADAGPQIDALRAQMFAATAAGHIERALSLSTTLRDRQLAIGDLAGAANECNNRAEELLRLGRAVDAMASAHEAGDLARRGGHRAVERFADVLAALGAAESGQLGAGIEALRKVDGHEANPIFAIDTAAALAFWLVERREGGDCADAAEVAARAQAQATPAGVKHVLTRLHATRARALCQLGKDAEARESLVAARGAADAADVESELHLALTMGDVLAVGEPAREVALRAARTKILLAAARREDPRRYCTGVRLHRRLLELSGGIPQDLPGRE